MIVCKCDGCGKELRQWLDVKIAPAALEDWIDVGRLMPYKTEKTLCVDCYKKIFGPEGKENV